MTKSEGDDRDCHAGPDCRAAYATLVERRATLLTPPVESDWEIRAFFRDPDGHLLEISEARG